MQPLDLEQRLTRAVERARVSSSDFDLNPGTVLPKNRVLKQAAVLVAVTEDAQVILTQRSARLKNHAGQVAFAGGRQDDTDLSLQHTALREANEEIGLDPGQVKILGMLPPHETVTRYMVSPVVAMIPANQTFKPEPAEVAEVFSVPLSHVTNPAHFRVEGRRWMGQMRHYYTVPYGPYYIWGATARMLRGLAEVWT